MDLSQEADGLSLRTSRLTLRNMTAADAPALRNMVTVPEVGRMLFMFPPDWTVAQAERFIADTRFRGTWPFRLGIYAGDRLVGSVGVGEGAEPAIFYFLAPEAHGHGYGQEALAALLRFLFDGLDRHTIHASVFHDNPGSAHILRRLGFRETGTDSYHSAARLEPEPITLYRLTRDAFVGQP